MVLGLTSKENAMEQARKLHQAREDMKTAYTDYLSLNNPNLLSFIRTVIPQISFSHTFDYETFKSDILNGSFGNVFHYQSAPPIIMPPNKSNESRLRWKHSED